MQKGLNILKKTVSSGVTISVILSIVAFAIIYQVWNIDLNVPSFCAHGDGTSTLTDMRNYLDGGWMFHFENMAAPYGCDAIKRSTDGLLNYGILYLLVRITKNIGLSLNLFYILTYPLTAAFAYIVLVRLNVKKEIAIVGGVLYSFVPYHYLRTMHLNLFTYFMIPFSLLGVILLISKNNKKLERRDFFLAFFGNLLLGIESLYYAAFGMIIYGIVLLYLFLKKNWKNLFPALILFGAIIIPCIITFSIPVFRGAEFGGNLAGTSRDPAQINIYGLRVWTILSPVIGHRLFDITGKVKELFNIFLGVSYDVHTMPMGISMALGFIVSIVTFLFYKKKEEEVIQNCGKINVIMIVLSVVNGINVLIGVLLTTSIRCYNRMSIFIAFSSIVAFCLFIQKWIFVLKSKSIIITICTGILLFCLWDQTPSWISKNVKIDEAGEHNLLETFGEYEEDYYAELEFWKSVEASLDEGDNVFCMPFVEGESYPWGYRMTETLGWNYNYNTWMKDDSYTEWMQHLDNLEVENAITEIKAKGITGVVVLRDMYDEEEYKRIEEQIEEIAGADPLLSKDGSLAFWKI